MVKIVLNTTVERCRGRDRSTRIFSFSHLLPFHLSVVDGTRRCRRGGLENTRQSSYEEMQAVSVLCRVSLNFSSNIAHMKVPVSVWTLNKKEFTCSADVN